MLYRNYLKRAFDLSLTIPLIVLAAPILLAIGCAVLASLGSPVLFSQKRPGRNGKPFWIRKFRTMSHRRGSDGNLLSDAQRLTTFGKWLRSSSLDELPELWNVLVGDMSLVGPRPLLEKYLDRYTHVQARRHEVRPGVTGWAQVNGRNAIDWETRLAMDVWYVDHAGFWLDLKILAKTIVKVIQRDGINAKGEATMTEFKGKTAGIPLAGPAAVIGAGGHAKVVISTLRAAGIEVEAAYDNNRALWGTTILGVPVAGPVERAAEKPERPAIIAIGAVAARRRLAEQLELRWLTVVHPHAWVDPTARLSPGTVVCAGAVIQADAEVGSHCVINTSASVDHDCRLEDYANLGPGTHLAGNVQVSQLADVGAGCTVIPGVHIGQGAVVGAGAVVIRNVPSRVTVVGCPAEVIKRRSAA